jgi:hypothetical protein
MSAERRRWRAMTTVVMHPQTVWGLAASQTNGRDQAHAGRPGSGPEGASCSECVWSLHREDGCGARQRKCNLTDWDGRPVTDIRDEDPACKYFDPR